MGQEWQLFTLNAQWKLLLVLKVFLFKNYLKWIQGEIFNSAGVDPELLHQDF